MNNDSESLAQGAPTIWTYIGPSSFVAGDNIAGRNLFWTNVLRHHVLEGIGSHSDLLMKAELDQYSYSPILFIDVVSTPAIRTYGTSDGKIGLIAQDYYDMVESQLAELERISDGFGAPVERGAILTAVEVIRQLRSLQMAPPEISWHGGDAIVMIWAFDSITWAVTVTDGEIGYVIRKNKKLHKLRDSILISDFELLEMK
jgi:hypothetical protein